MTGKGCLLILGFFFLASSCLLAVESTRSDNALQRYRALVKKHPREARYRYALGALYAKKQAYYMSRISLQMALEFEPDHKKARRLMAQVEEKLKLRAAKLAVKALKHYDKDEPLLAKRLCRRILDLDPHSELGLLVEGMLNDDEGNSQLARKCYKGVLMLNRGNGRAAARLAVYEVNDGLMEAAKAHIELALRTEPSEGASHAAKAGYLAAGNRYVEAIGAIERAIYLRPSRVENHIKKFNYHLLLKDFSAASSTIELLSALVPRLSALPFLRGRLEQKSGNLPKAIEHLKFFLRNGKETGPLVLWALSSISLMYEQLGNYREASHFIGLSMKMAPNNSEIIAQASVVREKWRLEKNGKRHRSGAFNYYYPSDLAVSVLKKIDALFQKSYRALSPLYSVKPVKLKVSILDRTHSGVPAFYDVTANEIIISRQYFEGEKFYSAEVEEHLIRHEFSHLMLRCRSGSGVFRLSNLWMIEGLAEFQAGVLDREGPGVLSIFSDGLLSFPQLGNFLAISSVGNEKLRFKAYLQAALMVDMLHSRYGSKACLRMIRTMEAIASNKATKLSYKRYLGLSYKEILSATKSRVELLKKKK